MSAYPEQLNYLIAIFCGMFGAIIGSFLNVCIYRLPRGYLSIVTTPSHCPQCGTHIAWYDNVPILSWLLLAGVCRFCRSPIRFRYIFVEMLTAVLFYCAANWVLLEPLPCFMSLELTQRWMALVVVWYLSGNLIVITFIDMDYRIIPDGLTFPGMLLAPLFSTICPLFHTSFLPVFSNAHIAGLLSSLVGILVGGGSLYFVGVIGKVIFRKDAMGFGDVKMMAMVGGFLGWDAALLIFLLACVAGTVVGLLWLLITRDHYIPFGPYLAAGTVIALFAKREILHFLFTVWPHWVSTIIGMQTYTFE
jgi:leader peptidase (prepilin peptidase)/N-methyltransferase